TIAKTLKRREFKADLMTLNILNELEQLKDAYGTLRNVGDRLSRQRQMCIRERIFTLITRNDWFLKFFSPHSYYF
ncbi:hypothetical protein, partial [Staphylococcus pseudintermedius]|uniref:hypothetical protein n=1 Tax=Staphylococcus pseudintermedius TaxID=283734 RepID=UPI001C6ED16D